MPRTRVSIEHPPCKEAPSACPGAPPRVAVAPPPPERPRRRRARVRGAVLTVLALLALPQAAHAATTTFTVDSLVNTSVAAASSDANTADGICATANATCTLRAAVQQANALPASPGDDIAIVFAGSGTLTLPANGLKMKAGGVSHNGISNDYLGSNYFFQIDANRPVTVDLGNDIKIESADDAPNGIFLVSSDGVTIRNFQNLRGGDSSIVVDKGTQNTTIANGTCADPTTPILEVCVGILAEASGVTITDLDAVSVFRFPIFVDRAQAGDDPVSNVAITRLDSKGTEQFGDLWVELDAKIDGFTVEDSDFDSPAGYAVGLQSGSSTTDLAITNSRFVADNAFAIFAYPNSDTTNLRVEDSTFDGTRWAFVDHGGSEHDGLVLRGNRFEDVFQHVLDFVDATYTDAVIEDNDFINQRGDGLTTVWIRQPGTNNVVRNNVFRQDDGVFQNRWAIYSQANVAESADTGWSFTGNSIQGYKAAASGPIVALGNGRTRMERNTFDQNTRGTTSPIQSEAQSGWFVTNYGGRANSRIQTWRPTAAVLDPGVSVQLTVAPVTPPLGANTAPTTPVDVDVFWTADDNAEEYVGRIDDVSATTTVTLPTTKTGGNFRVQTQDAAGRSSQYSAPFQVGPDTSPPNPPTVIAIDQVGTLSGEGEPGATVTVLDQDASPIATTPVQDDGTWQVEGPFACGTTVSATQTDAAGNASPASTPGVPACNDGSGPKRCTPGQIIVSGNSPADLLRVVADTGGYRTSAIDASGSVTYNGIGYNAADGLVYAVAENGHLLKLGVQDAATTDLGAVSNLPAGTYAAGAFGPDGAYYVKPLDGTTMYRIDVANRLATEVELSAPAKVSDFALIAGRLWGKHNDQATIMRIDPTTGQVDAFPATGVVPGGLVQAAGGAWKFGNGDLGLVFNSSSEIRQVRIAGADTATPTFSLVSVGRTEAVNGNVDGTYCEGAETDLAIAKTGRVTAMTGADSTLAWEITVSNRGTTASSGAVVTDQLPAPVTDVATATEGCTVDGRTVRCLVGSLAPGATASIAVTGRVVGTLGRVDNTARVEGQDADPTSTNDTATASLAPPPTAPAVDLPNGTTLPQGANRPLNYSCGGAAAPVTCAATVTRPDGTVVPIASGAPLPTDVPGTYVVTVTGVDALGQSTTTTTSYVVAAPNRPVVGAPADGHVVGLGETLPVSYTCSGVVLSTVCTAAVTKPDGTTVPVASGAPLPTDQPGVHTITVTTTSVLGQTTTSTSTYRVRRTSGQLMLDCAERSLVLVDVRRVGNRVRLQGVTRATQAGKRVALRFQATGAIVARPTVQRDGTFEAFVSLPSARVRATNRARYRAELEGERSLNLKLARRMDITGLRQGSEIRISGRVSRPLAAPVATITVRERTECGTPAKVVARIKPASDGRFTVTFAAPERVDSAIYRLETRVRKTRSNPKTYPTYTLIRGVDFP